MGHITYDDFESYDNEKFLEYKTKISLNMFSTIKLFFEKNANYAFYEKNGVFFAKNTEHNLNTNRILKYFQNFFLHSITSILFEQNIFIVIDKNEINESIKFIYHIEDCEHLYTYYWYIENDKFILDTPFIEDFIIKLIWAENDDEHVTFFPLFIKKSKNINLEQFIYTDLNLDRKYHDKFELILEQDDINQLKPYIKKTKEFCYVEISPSWDFDDNRFFLNFEKSIAKNTLFKIINKIDNIKWILKDKEINTIKYLTSFFQGDFIFEKNEFVCKFKKLNNETKTFNIYLRWVGNQITIEYPDLDIDFLIKYSELKKNFIVNFFQQHFIRNNTNDKCIDLFLNKNFFQNYVKNLKNL